jgi:hypothetical protein
MKVAFGQETAYGYLEKHCFMMAFVYEVLHAGFGFPTDYDGLYLPGRKINGKSYNYVIGKMLYETRFFPLK